MIDTSVFDTSTDELVAGHGKGIEAPDNVPDAGGGEVLDTQTKQPDASPTDTSAPPIDAGSGVPPDLGAYANQPKGLAWPVACTPGYSCYQPGLPDIDGNGIAYHCGKPGYTGHTGLDIAPAATMLEAGVTVHAAADGLVMAVYDLLYDKCPDPKHPQCQPATESAYPTQVSGYRWCTDLGSFCDNDDPGCYLCFHGNAVVLRHEGWATTHSTVYTHIATGSAKVKVGQSVKRGEVLALVGSSGKSATPHLHFEPWLTKYNDPVDPFAGPCGSNTVEWLWEHALPWAVTPTAGPAGP
jgi:murein DD-endopeptidase MepM/ murein hydrolase activator NlpD